MKGKKKTFRHLFLALVLGAFLYVFGNAVSIWQFAKVDEKCKADVAIVLGASSYNGVVSPVFKERINHGIWLYENDYAEVLIMTGGIGAENECSDAYAAKQYAVLEGVPEEDILLEETSTITQENLENAKVLMEENGYETAVIVSDPLHMKRSMLMAKDYGIKACSSPTPTTRYISIDTKVEFLTREVFFYIGYKVYRIFA